MKKFLTLPALWWNFGALVISVVVSWLRDGGGWKLLAVTSVVNIVFVALQYLNIGLIRAGVTTGQSLYGFIKGFFAKKPSEKKDE